MHTTPARPQPAPPTTGQRATKAAVFVLALFFAGVLGWMKYHPRAEALLASQHTPAMTRLPAPVAAAPEQKDWQGKQAELREAAERAKASARGEGATLPRRD